MPKKQKWVMPEWMKPLQHYFANTGGNEIEDLMNRDVDARANLPVAMIQVAVESQVIMLNRLRGAGLID